MDRAAQVLLVEDARMDAELTLDAFREAELPNAVRVASNGQEAIDYLTKADGTAEGDGHALPDIVLLDLKMPGMSGFDVLSWIKSQPRLKRLPVIILTSSNRAEDRAQSYDQGANSYLVKPISYDGFVTVVQKVTDYWLSLNEGPPDDE